MPIANTISDVWCRFQEELFPALTEILGPLSDRHRKLVTVLEFATPEALLPAESRRAGRPREDRAALARSFIAKAVWNMPTTRDLLDRVHADPTLRRLCGWSRRSEIPSEATFSRAFAEFADSEFPARVHAAMIRSLMRDKVVEHISRDSTAIEARERPERKPKPETKPETSDPEKPKRGRGRPRKGEVVERPERRLERQPGMSLDEMIRDLPKGCAVGSKRNAKGRRGSWTGCRPHIDAADGEVPVGRLLTSASLHDSRAAIPLAKMTGGRVTYFHELMDSAHDAPEIHRHGEQSGHVPIIDVNPRRDKALKELKEMEPKARANVNIPDPRAIRYSNRSTVERVNARLKDEFGGRHVRVRGHAKVFAHIMFGILALAIDQLQRHML